MGRPVVFDVHIHLYPTEASAKWSLEGYDIWEYGTKSATHFLSASGTVEDIKARLASGELDGGVVVNLFAPDLFRDEAIANLAVELSMKDRDAAMRAIDIDLGRSMIEFNRWLVDALQPIPELTPFIGLDPSVASASETVHHLQEMASQGAKGVKLHPVLQRFSPSDPRMRSVYTACMDANLTILSHSGGSRGPVELADPFAFSAVMREFPGLRLILAHLGGSKWRQTADFAQAFPSVSFDLSEIIQWVGASNGPTRDELAELILAVGSERVMLGTDYPWYDMGSTLEVLMQLPRLAEEQKVAIAGENALRVLGLSA